MGRKTLENLWSRPGFEIGNGPMPREHATMKAGEMADCGTTSRAPTRRSMLINIGELSQRLSIATGTLYNWVYLRRIPFIKAGRCVRFDYDAVLAALRQGTLEEVSRR